MLRCPERTRPSEANLLGVIPSDSDDGGRGNDGEAAVTMICLSSDSRGRGGSRWGKEGGKDEGELGFGGAALMGRGESTWWPSGLGAVGWPPRHGPCLLFCKENRGRGKGHGGLGPCYRSTRLLMHSVHLAPFPSS